MAISKETGELVWSNEVLSCINTAITTFDPDNFTLTERDAAIMAVQDCYGEAFESNWFNAIVALNLDTGEKVWADTPPSF